MKNILLAFMLFHFTTLGFSQSNIQNLISFVNTDIDSAKTVFGHFNWSAKSKLNFNIPPIIEDGYILPFEEIYYDTLEYQLQFLNNPWINTSFTLPSDPLITRIGLQNEIYLGLTFDFFRLFDEDPALFNLIKEGGTVKIRASVRISIDGNSFERIYSNIDTIYLPPASSDDIEGFQYLKNTFGQLKKFSITFDPDIPIEKWEFINNHYSNSIISDYAKIHIFQNNCSQLNKQGNPLTQEDYLEIAIPFWQSLSLSKSEKIADWGKMFLKSYHVTD